MLYIVANVHLARLRDHVTVFEDSVIRLKIDNSIRRTGSAAVPCYLATTMCLDFKYGDGLTSVHYGLLSLSQ